MDTAKKAPTNVGTPMQNRDRQSKDRSPAEWVDFAFAALINLSWPLFYLKIRNKVIILA